MTSIILTFGSARKFGNAISPSTISRYGKKMGAKMCISYIKPSLSIKQKIESLEFIVGKVEHTGHGYYRFVDQKHVNHVDEKLFHSEKSKSKIRMFPCDDITLTTSRRHD